MTGPENYREAEQIIAEYEAIVEQGGDPGDMLQIAQIRATLALAAATALAAMGDGMPTPDYTAWHAVVHTPDTRTSAYEDEGEVSRG